MLKLYSQMVILRIFLIPFFQFFSKLILFQNKIKLIFFLIFKMFDGPMKMIAVVNLISKAHPNLQIT